MACRKHLHCIFSFKLHVKITSHKMKESDTAAFSFYTRQSSGDQDPLAIILLPRD